MPLSSMSADRVQAVDRVLHRGFGVDRCMFASNFPVDAMHGTFDELFTVYDELTAALDADSAREALRGHRRRVYRC